MVHGAWHTGACFQRLEPYLKRAGHRMIAPNLPGMDGDARALARASLRRWADFIVEEAKAVGSPVILCAHSRGGIVASQAAEQCPEAFSALVYLSGALIPDGRSMYDVLGAVMEKGAFGQALAPVSDGLGLRFASSAAAQFFYNDCSEQDQRELAEKLVVEPVRPMGAALRLTASRYGSVGRHYVECANDQTFPLTLQQSMQAVLPCQTVHRLESDHSPFISMPLQLATALDQIAGVAEQDMARSL
jgi:pimeloyl-ACP methyl ester carboxylesterase